MGRIKDTIDANKTVREAKQQAKHDPYADRLVSIARARRADAARGHGRQPRNGW